MARVTVVLPRMLAEAHGKGRVEVEGDTLGEAIEALFRESPALRFHVCEESGEFRPHILCFLNDERMIDRSARLRDGDRISFLQAISGG